MILADKLLQPFRSHPFGKRRLSYDRLPLLIIEKTGLLFHVFKNLPLVRDFALKR